MQARTKLRTAQTLMTLGVLPLLLGIAWIIGVVVYARQHPGQAGLSDAFLMMAVLVVTYGFAVVIAGAAALWSAIIVRRDPGLRSRSATVARMVVGIVLTLPLLFYAAITLASLGWFQ